MLIPLFFFVTSSGFFKRFGNFSSSSPGLCGWVPAFSPPVWPWYELLRVSSASTVLPSAVSSPATFCIFLPLTIGILYIRTGFLFPSQRRYGVQSPKSFSLLGTFLLGVKGGEQPPTFRCFHSPLLFFFPLSSGCRFPHFRGKLFPLRRAFFYDLLFFFQPRLPPRTGATASVSPFKVLLIPVVASDFPPPGFFLVFQGFPGILTLPPYPQGIRLFRRYAHGGPCSLLHRAPSFPTAFFWRALPPCTVPLPFLCWLTFCSTQ